MHFGKVEELLEWPYERVSWIDRGGRWPENERLKIEIMDGVYNLVVKA